MRGWGCIKEGDLEEKGDLSECSLTKGRKIQGLLGKCSQQGGLSRGSLWEEGSLLGSLRRLPHMGG